MSAQNKGNKGLYALRICFWISTLLFFGFILSLPIVQLGLWKQSEAVIIALHAFSGLNALALGFFIFERPVFARVLRHPFVIAPFAIGLISILTAPFAALPIRHIFGSVQMGEGLLWWFDLSILTASFFILVQLKPLRRALSLIATLAFLAIFGLTMAREYGESGFVPYFFPDYTAFLILALIPLAYTCFKQGLSKFAGQGALYASLIILMYLSSNLVGLAYAVLGVGFFILLFALPMHTKIFGAPLRERIGLLAIGVVPLLALTILLTLAFWPFEEGYYTILSNEVLVNLTSRGYLIQTVLSHLAEHPYKFITGEGWGSFNEILSQHLPSDWLNFTTVESQQWDGLTTDHFHSHNEFIELLYSAGLFAALTFYLFILSIPLKAKQSLKFPAFVVAGGLATLCSFWFIVPLAMPFIALSLAILADRRKALKCRFLSTGAFSNALLVIASVLFMGSVYLFHQALTATDYKPAELNITADITPACTLELNDYQAGALPLSQLLLRRARYSVGLDQNIKDAYEDPDNLPEHIDLSKKPIEDLVKDWQGEIAEEIPRINNLYCQSNMYVSRFEPSNRLKLARLLTRGEVLLTLAPYMNEPTKTYYRRGWSKELQNWLKQAPERTDIAVPFLLHNIINQNERASIPVLTLIEEQTPQNPVGLWFTGLTMLNDPRATQEGIARMRQALQNGIERFVPVDKPTKTQLLGRQAP